MLGGKRVALVINQTSRIGSRLLVDSLLGLGVRITKIFVPEHGFRGVADAGAHIRNSRDSATGLPIISLYGNNKKPKPEQLQDVDVVIYDLQDVGVRFYTYISTLEYVMEACAETGRRLIILDRPNPLGHYIAGPVLDTALRSFVGMQPVPIVYGMTPGEYARMLVGERWINGAERLRLEVIRCKNWDHTTRYALPVAPSPNLRTMGAVYLYPALCLFEGTVISVGRGTDKPFEQWGHPALSGQKLASFRPASTVGATNPPYEGQLCYGYIADADLISTAQSADNMLLPGLLINMYNQFPDKDKFFNSFFEKLAGTKTLRQQIIRGASLAEINESWKPALSHFKSIRRKYLLYADFE
jgi:uncharacterized protein YbbC (DUF1343 family)